jgi:hypothetical protein
MGGLGMNVYTIDEVHAHSRGNGKEAEGDKREENKELIIYADK